jgi:DNA-binding PadR family transcriptional regulator
MTRRSRLLASRSSIYRLTIYTAGMTERASRTLREPTYFILASLLDGPLHGYGLIGRAAELSGGRIRLTAGTLYGALDRLSAEGMVEPDGEEVVAGRLRRIYRLTPGGIALVAAEAERLRQAAAVVDVRLPAGSLKAVRA